MILFTASATATLVSWYDPHPRSDLQAPPLTAILYSLAAFWSCGPVDCGAEHPQAAGGLEGLDGRAELSRVEEVSRVQHNVSGVWFGYYYECLV